MLENDIGAHYMSVTIENNMSDGITAISSMKWIYHTAQYVCANT